jgi:hypothetical protein
MTLCVSWREVSPRAPKEEDISDEVERILEHAVDPVEIH